MAKKIVKLNEASLQRIIKNSVKALLKEGGWSETQREAWNESWEETQRAAAEYATKIKSILKQLDNLNPYNAINFDGTPDVEACLERAQEAIEECIYIAYDKLESVLVFCRHIENNEIFSDTYNPNGN